MEQISVNAFFFKSYRMPYTKAVINEVQRFAYILPMGVFHSPISRTDVELEGYNIPKVKLILRTIIIGFYYNSLYELLIRLNCKSIYELLP